MMCTYDKAAIHLFINKHHCSSADIFFKIITNLGDGIFIIIISLLLVLWKVRYALYSVSVYLLSGFFVQFFKRVIWPEALRPVTFFSNEVLHLVDKVDLHHYHSFPSGHTASAFGLFVLLIMIVKNKILQWLFFVTALVVGFSRIYLSQHFLIDVITGSVIGVICALALYKLFMSIHAKWFEYSLIKRNE